MGAAIFLEERDVSPASSVLAATHACELPAGALFANTLGIQVYGRGCDTPERGLANVNLQDEVARDAHRHGAGLRDGPVETITPIAERDEGETKMRNALLAP